MTKPRPKQHGRARPYAEIEPVSQEWLVRPWLPRGAVTVVAGNPGVGKSLLLCRIAADLSRGRYGPPATSLLASAEDADATQMRPRLEAAGADLRLVQSLNDHGFVLPDDIEWLEEQVLATQAALLALDPLQAFLSDRVNTWSDHGVRRALGPLAQLADRTGCAVPVALHLNKRSGSDPLRRLGGSIGFRGAARSVVYFGHDPEDPAGSGRILAQDKSNYSAGSYAARYDLTGGQDGQAPALHYVEECDYTAAEILDAHLRHGTSLHEEAVAFLKQALEGRGWRWSQDVQREAAAAGIAPKTLRVAREAANVADKREKRFQGRSFWHWPAATLPPLPAAADPAPTPAAPPTHAARGTDADRQNAGVAALAGFYCTCPGPRTAGDICPACQLLQRETRA